MDVKKGLECCFVSKDCRDCPYDRDGCVDNLMHDAYAYVKQLEERCERLLRTAEVLEAAKRMCQANARYPFRPDAHVFDGPLGGV